MYCFQFYQPEDLFHLWSGWTCVTVDDLVPVDGQQKIMFGATKDLTELWALLVEKAYAKFLGSYIFLHDGDHGVCSAACGVWLAVQRVGCGLQCSVWGVACSAACGVWLAVQRVGCGLQCSVWGVACSAACGVWLAVQRVGCGLQCSVWGVACSAACGVWLAVQRVGCGLQCSVWGVACSAACGVWLAVQRVGCGLQCSVWGVACSAACGLQCSVWGCFFFWPRLANFGMYYHYFSPFPPFPGRICVILARLASFVLHFHHYWRLWATVLVESLKAPCLCMHCLMRRTSLSCCMLSLMPHLPLSRSPTQCPGNTSHRRALEKLSFHGIMGMMGISVMWRHPLNRRMIWLRWGYAWSRWGMI